MQYFYSCRSLALLLVVVSSFSGCALLAPPRDVSVSSKDLVIQKLLSQGSTQLAASRFADADLSYAQVLYLDPELASAKVGMVRSLVGIGLLAEARNVSRELQLQFPGDRRYRALTAFVDARTENKADAITSFESLVKETLQLGLTDEAADYLRNIADIYFALGEEEKAFCASLDAYALRRTSKEELFRHVRMALATNRDAGLAGLINGAISVIGLPSDPAFHFVRALQQYSSGRIELALQSLRSASQLEGASASLASELELLQAVIRYRLDPKNESVRQLLQEILPSVLENQKQTVMWPSELVREVYLIAAELTPKA